MPPDRSARPVRPALSKPYDLSTSPSPQPPSKTSHTDGAGRLMVDNSLALSASDTIVPTSVAESSAPLQTGRVDDIPIPTDVPPIPNLNQPQPSGQSPHCSVSSLDHHRDHRPDHHSLHSERNTAPPPQAPHAHIDAAIFGQHTQPHTVHSVAQLQPLPDHSDPINHQYHQAENPSRHEALFKEQRSLSHSLCPRLKEPPSCLQDTSLGSFNQAHDFVMNHPTFVDNSSDNFMASLLEATMKGAEFDSSDRHMPLRCHPGTRVNIIRRCQDFVLNREGRPRLRWVVGSAGVGKSAIMQSVAHDESDVLSDVIVGATIFFSINGRQDGRKAITTMAYQLAVKIERYRLFVQREVTCDPSLLHKSLPTQFKKFLVEPFILRRVLGHSSQLLIIIDGLDECAEISVQRELLSLISDFCIKYPTSPIVWMIASRPEPHITSFFSRPDVAPSYEKEEILVETDEAREDVKRYLRDKFDEIQMESISLQHLSRWPSEDDYLKVADAAGGLLAYASTVVRYVGDPEYGDPVRLLDDVVTIIERGTKENRWGRNHPMAQLDALYSHIMSKIPVNVMADTRKLLLLIGIRAPSLPPPSFLDVCNMLEMGQTTAYSATHHIRAIAKVPGPTEAEEGRLELFHKSFYDYLQDFERSGFSPDFDSEANQLMCHTVLRILEQAPDGVYLGSAASGRLFLDAGRLKNGPGTGEGISLSWPDPGDNNRSLRFRLFHTAVYALLRGLGEGEKAFQTLLCMRVLTTCFARLPGCFPRTAVQNFTFDECRRRELLEDGILKRVPLHKINDDDVTIRPVLNLRFRGPAVEQSNPWNVNCKHTRNGRWDGQGQDWSTSWLNFPNYRNDCAYCTERFFYHMQTRQPDHCVTVLDVTPTSRMVEFQFDDGVSQWTYICTVK